MTRDEILQASLKALTSWRTWAQFVFLDGGPVTLDDDALRAAVCDRWDKEKTELRSERDALAAEIAALRATNAELEKRMSTMRHDPLLEGATVIGTMTYNPETGEERFERAAPSRDPVSTPTEKLLGLDVKVDPAIPRDSIVVRNKRGEDVGGITGLDPAPLPEERP